MKRVSRACVAGLLVIAGAGAGAAEQEGQAPLDPALEAMRADATALDDLVATGAARALLDAVGALPPAEPARVWYRPGGGYLAEAYTAAQREALDDDQRKALREVVVDTARYYETFYGSPLASIRAYDLAARHGAIETYDDRRVLDFGFGSVGQLRLLAAVGADAVGTEVMPLLRAIYAHDGADGPFGKGRVTMVFGRWPAEANVVEKVGAGFDLFVSKNTLKRGYVAPPVEVDPSQRLDFGVEPAEFLRRLGAALKPGGLAVIYNLGGRPPAEGEPYSPMTDIACPWSRGELESAGFEVLAIDERDDETARRYAHALGWDEDGMELNDLFARYTVLRRPAEAE